MKESISEKVRSLYAKAGINVMLLLGAIGVMLISFEDIFPERKNTNTDISTVTQYKENLEDELEKILSLVSGAGQVKVMVTLESGRENIYAWQEKTTNDEKSDYTGSDSVTCRQTYENEIVMINTGSDKTALIEKTMEPVVQGVVVVCSGADDIKVTSDITNAVSVALNVTSNRICVIKMD